MRRVRVTLDCANGADTLSMLVDALRAEFTCPTRHPSPAHYQLQVSFNASHSSTGKEVCERYGKQPIVETNARRVETFSVTAVIGDKNQKSIVEELFRDKKWGEKRDCHLVTARMPSTAKASTGQK